MRKDLKIGLAIGAVLLVLLIVYVAVPKSADDTGQMAQDASSTEGQSADDQSTDDAGQLAGEAPAPEQGETTVATATDPFEKDAETSAAPSDVAAGGTSSAEGASAGGTNWAKLLDTGEMPLRTITPSLSATETVPPEQPAAPEAPAIPAAAEERAPSVVTAEQPAAPAAVSPSNESAESSTTGPAAAAEKPAVVSEESSRAAGTTAATPRTHKIKSGETYSSIAKIVYGDSRHYLDIEKANPDVDATRLKPGMVINLPEVAKSNGKTSNGSSPADDAAVTASGRQERELDPAKEYRVQANDNLHVIAKRIYKSSAMADEIYELNKGTIGSDSSKLKIGMVLKLPPKPAADSER